MKATKRFHFDLSHLGDETPELTFHVGRKQHSVQVHTAETRAAAIQTNRALALIPKSHHHRITHFVDVSQKHLPTDRLCRLKVTFKHPNEKINLPVLVHAAFHIPEQYRTAHRQKKFAQQASPQVPPKLRNYGVQADALEKLRKAPNSKQPRMLKAGPSAMAAAATLDQSGDGTNGDHVVISNHLDQFQGPPDAAAFILFHHPALGSSDPYTATKVMDDHINSPENQNALNDLSVAIGNHDQVPAGDQGDPDAWAIIQTVTAADGSPMNYEFKLGSHNPGDPVQHYVLAQDVQDAMPAALKNPINSAADDPALQNKKWSVTQGRTAIHKTVPAAQTGGPRLLRAGAPSSFKWTLANQNASHGLSVDSDSIEFSPSSANDGSGTFRIEAKNEFLRTLGFYVEFIDESGNVISDPEGWTGQLPAGSERLETSNKKYVGIVPPVNNIMGIPVPTDYTRYSFSWPANATGARLYFGGLGNGEDWDGDVCVPGLILTGILQYGIPVMFLAAAAAIKDTKWYADFMADDDNLAALFAVGIPVVGGIVTPAAVKLNTKQVLFAFADVITGLLVKAALEKLMAYVIGQIAEEDAEEAIPFAGWVLMALMVAAEVAQIVETTGEVLSCPFTLRYDVARAFDLKVTVKPDPKHGMVGKPETAVWPAVSNNYDVIVQYERGTNFVHHETMPTTTSSTPISLTFKNLPAGGRLQIIAAIYSKSGWLCGKWTSGWMDAVPDDGTTLNAPEGRITEQLVPLTTDSQYVHKEKIVCDVNGKHIWQADTPSVATSRNLNTSNTSAVLSKLVNMTIFEANFEIGYTWQAAPQGLPLTGSKATNPGQAYAFRNLSVLADPESQLKFPNRSFAGQPYIVYDQFAQPATSDFATKPHQFFFDPRQMQGNLRQINVDDGNSTIDLTVPLKSWGRFPLSSVDAMVINSGKVMAASWADHKLAILQIPDAPVDDAQAPLATVVSGEGVRQGLLNGPIAMAVTPDGRALVLETGNRRVQAFDLSGNPVPCFDGPRLFSVSGNFSTSLDGRSFPNDLQTAFQQNNATHLFDLDPKFVANLDQSQLTDDLRKAFGLQGIFLSVHANDPASNTTISVVTASRQWQIECQGTNRIYTITASPDASSLGVYAVLNNVTVTVRQPGQQWILKDGNGAVSYDVRQSPDQAGMLDVHLYLSYMPLQNPAPGQNVVYLDLATEARGYIYVLGYTGAGNAEDYFLDIYEPNGAFLCRTPDSRYTSTPQNVVAARMVVDTWRNVFTLNYEALAGINGSTEPSIGHWMPMPPLFSLELSDQPSFDELDIASVRSIFGSQHIPITLGERASIAIISELGHWQVRDGSIVYDVIRSGDKLDKLAKLDVYKLAPGARI